MSVAFKIGLLLLLILINAFFAMSEIAIISLNDNKMKKMAEEGNKKAAKLVRLTSQPSKFLSTIQVGVTLAGFLTAASASTNFAEILNNFIVGQFKIVSSAAQSVIFGVSVVVITVITSYFSLVLGELVPKQIGMQKCESIALAVAGPLLAVKTVLAPIIFVLTVSTNGIVRLFGLNPDADNERVTEEEIRMMVDVGEETGVIEESQREMINNIFEFDDIDVGDVMNHRTEIVAVDIQDDLNDVIKLAIEEGFSRIPVFEEDLDNIVGIIYVKDLLKYIGKTVPKTASLKKYNALGLSCPRNQKLRELFKEMTEKHIQMAIVVDEYGGTAGIVTLEDLIESILGNIQDEYDDEEEEIQKVNDTTFSVEGTCDIEEVEEMLNTELPRGDYDTLGGLILSILGYIPEENENPCVSCAGWNFTVQSIDERRIELVKAEKMPEENEE